MADKKQSLRYLSGIAISILGIYAFFSTLSSWDWNLGEFIGYISDFEYFEYNITTYFYLATIVAFIISGILVIANKSALISLCVAFALNALYYIILTFYSLIDNYDEWFIYMLYALPYIFAAILFVPASIVNLSSIKKLWFIPAVIDLISWLEPLISGYDFSYINVPYMLIDVIAIALSCYWVYTIRNNPITKIVPVKGEIKKDYFSENQKIDELKKFKDLFESGIITQEEFDTKKKQLLEN